MAIHKSALLTWTSDSSYEKAPESAFDSLLDIPVIPEAAFVRMLRLERRRTERSGRPFMLVLISYEDLDANPEHILLDYVVTAVSSAIRETDILGWYQYDRTLGILMTELGQTNSTTVNTITKKISMAVQEKVTPDKFNKLSFQFRLFPQEVDKSFDSDGNNIHYPDLSRRHRSKHSSGHILKRGLDIAGSLFALTLFMPLFLILAILVKLTSRGPVLFCQRRVGRYGKEFNFYKFRTMYTGNDPRIHQEYVSKLIAGELNGSNGVYKIVNDPRITPIGRFLRKSSLDELPQFFNILKNDMSLVGPRPPLPYEFERYQTWHKRRVLELKPGLTGLWQVEGRSRTTFDEMVRMDLRYAIGRSLWVDVKIILQTPSAMFSGRGAC
jgi:lipopolysaccharide/colanic/teichoic acid biosynthesis glycosyltransferase